MAPSLVLPPNCSPLLETLKSPIVQNLIQRSRWFVNLRRFEKGTTYLHEASGEGHLSVVKYLVENGANLNPRQRVGSTPLYLASAWGRLGVVQYLVAQGAEIDSKDKWGSTPLIMASIGGKLTIVQCLAEHGATINAQNVKNGRTALHWASGKGYLKVVRYLVEQGAAVDARCKDKNTPLHYASANGQRNVVEWLAETAAADVLALNKDWNYPLFLAASSGDNLSLVFCLAQLTLPVLCVWFQQGRKEREEKQRQAVATIEALSFEPTNVVTIREWRSPFGAAHSKQATT